MQPGQPGMMSGSHGLLGQMPAGTDSVGTGGMTSAPRAAGTGPLQLAADEISSRKYEAAITRLKGVIQKDKANAQAHYLLAVAYASSHQTASAKEEYEATLKYAQDMKLQKLASAGLAKMQGK